jgi:hypothetical protein
MNVAGSRPFLLIDSRLDPALRSINTSRLRWSHDEQHLPNESVTATVPHTDFRAEHPEAGFQVMSSWLSSGLDGRISLAVVCRKLETKGSERRVRRNRCVEPHRNGSRKLVSGHWEREHGWEAGARSSLQPYKQSVARESGRAMRRWMMVGRCVSCVLDVSVCEEMMRLRKDWRLLYGCSRAHLMVVCVFVCQGR